jgi:hypothetical protein
LVHKISVSDVAGNQFSIGPFSTCFGNYLFIVRYAGLRVPTASGVKRSLADAAAFNTGRRVDLTLLAPRIVGLREEGGIADLELR